MQQKRSLTLKQSRCCSCRKSVFKTSVKKKLYARHLVFLTLHSHSRDASSIHKSRFRARAAGRRCTRHICHMAPPPRPAPRRAGRAALPARARAAETQDDIGNN